MTHSPNIYRGDVFHFDGLPGTARSTGTPMAGTLPDLDATTTGVLVKVVAITWTGDLHLVRGHRDPETDTLNFPDYDDATGAQVALSEARAMIAANVWRRYRH